MTPSTYPPHLELVIPAPCGWISANDRMPWRQKAELTRTWRQAAGWLGRRAKLPAMQRAEIEVWLTFGDARRRDPHNYMPTAKAAIDGLVDIGMLPDDDSKHLTVTRVDITDPDPKRQRGVLTLKILRVEEAA